MAPVLMYGSEVWGLGNNDALERIQLMYCKYILGLKKSTISSLLYRELGGYLIDIRIKTKIISCWSRIVTSQKNYKLTSLTYKTLYQLHTNKDLRSSWLGSVENILNHCGMPNAWQCQCQGINSQKLKRAVKNRLQE